MKNIYTLSDEELVKVALDSESITTALSRKGDFNIQKCMVCAMDNIGRYFRGSIGLPAYASLDKDQKHEPRAEYPKSDHHFIVQGGPKVRKRDCNADGRK